jgi:hypothetical protein
MNTFTLTFNEQEMQTVLNAVADLPFKVAAPVVNSINMQLAAIHQKRQQEQQEASKSAAEPKGKAAKKVNGAEPPTQEVAP